VRRTSQRQTRSPHLKGIFKVCAVRTFQEPSIVWPNICVGSHALCRRPASQVRVVSCQMPRASVSVVTLSRVNKRIDFLSGRILRMIAQLKIMGKYSIGRHTKVKSGHFLLLFGVIGTYPEILSKHLLRIIQTAYN